MIPVITAVIGGIVVIAGALVARSATRHAARLQALQRRHDSDLGVLKEFNEGVLALVYATGKYEFTVKHMASGSGGSFQKSEQFLSGLSEEQKELRMTLLLQIVECRERVRFLSSGLPWDDIREQYLTGDTFASLLRDDKLDEAFAWSAANPDVVQKLVELIGERRRKLLASYPTSVPKPPGWLATRRDRGLNGRPRRGDQT
jgi:hypothetical protein